MTKIYKNYEQAMEIIKDTESFIDMIYYQEELDFDVEIDYSVFDEQLFDDYEE